MLNGNNLYFKRFKLGIKAMNWVIHLIDWKVTITGRGSECHLQRYNIRQRDTSYSWIRSQYRLKTSWTEKGRDLTQSWDQNPYTTEQYKKQRVNITPAPKTLITQLLLTGLGRSSGVTAVWRLNDDFKRSTRYPCLCSLLESRINLRIEHSYEEQARAYYICWEIKTP